MYVYVPGHVYVCICICTHILSVENHVHLPLCSSTAHGISVMFPRSISGGLQMVSMQLASDAWLAVDAAVDGP